ncbi:hypothetical protein ABT095_27300 [Kitasatospora sp. NPDC002227]|uniref:hypothetical protein n=1 Tax=Kitasatospora sp. NPDC002227 TaxID=3154773 RepID=UPI003325630B
MSDTDLRARTVELQAVKADAAFGPSLAATGAQHGRGKLTVRRSEPDSRHPEGSAGPR